MSEYIVINQKFRKPENSNQKIFRYMDYRKFKDLIKRSELYFSRIDKQEDDHEGKLLIAPPFSDVEYFRKPYEGLRKNTYINCWRMDDNISSDMGVWDAYCEDINHSVAIESTYGRLCNSIILSIREIYIGMVEYDYNENKLKEEMDYIYMFKHPDYTKESELRAVIPLGSYVYSQEEINPGAVPDDHMYVLINLNTLITKVHVSPKASVYFDNMVNAIISKCRR
ncbi:MAG: hypothetical protein WA113_06515 [Desulfitobacteriaceae bacterium]